jgi:hypothetical protein
MNTTPAKNRVTMDFLAAMREILAGRKVARLSWHNDDYCWLSGEWLSIFRDDSAERPGTHRWAIHESDMQAKDWIIVY